MAVQASERQVLRMVGRLDSAESRTRYEGQTELLVLMARSNEFVRMRLHTGLHTDEYVLGGTLLTGDAV